MSDISQAGNNELFTSRVIQATPEKILQAFRDPACLAQWWGPKGFRNTFHHFDFKPGGHWCYDMIGPDDKVYPNESVFEEISPARIVLRHLEPVHHFVLTITLVPGTQGTRLSWRQAFDTAAECDRVRPYAPRCNEENLDRLEAALGAAADPRTAATSNLSSEPSS